MFTGNFTISINTLTAFTVTDTSDYSSEPKATFSGRKIYLYKADGTTLVPSGTTTAYIDFPFSGGDTITIDVLDRDIALNIKVEWDSNAPQPGSTYTKTVLTGFTGNLENFYYGLTQSQTATPNIVNDTFYFQNKSTLRTFIDDVYQSVTIGDDIFAAQSCIDSAYYMVDNQKLFF